MPLINEAFDSLPYLDADPTPQERAQASALISRELASEWANQLHPLLAEAYQEPAFSPLISQELERVAASQKLEAIDTSRYEMLDPPSETDQSQSTVEKWNDALQKAYAAHIYLKRRNTALSALDEHGKNAWLMGNYQLEQELRQIEQELARTNQATENINKERKAAQDGIRGELEGLEATWRKGLGRVLEVEIANEGLRRQIMETQFKGTGG